MINVENLNKSFDDHKILKNLNINIKNNEKVAITGPSGCGKSTLLNILCGIESGDSGLVKVCSVVNPKIGKTKPSFYSHIISILMQDYGLIASDSIFENIKIGEPKITKKQAQDALLEVGLDLNLESKVHTLSGGEKQRVALARVLVKPSEIVLCDEPTGNLDTDTARDIEQLILSLDRTVVIVTHDLEFANKCDRTIKL